MAKDKGTKKCVVCVNCGQPGTEDDHLEDYDGIRCHPRCIPIDDPED